MVSDYESNRHKALMKRLEALLFNALTLIMKHGDPIVIQERCGRRSVGTPLVTGPVKASLSSESRTALDQWVKKFGNRLDCAEMRSLEGCQTDTYASVNENENSPTNPAYYRMDVRKIIERMCMLKK